jgi:hypothetical protein
MRPFEIDTTPPPPPTLVQPSSPTKQTPITLTGSAEPKSSVQVFVNGLAQRSARADDAGSFSIDVDLHEGENRITARAIDASGNLSEESQPAVVILDIIPPEPPVLKPLPSTTSTAEITLEGNAEPNSHVGAFVNEEPKGESKAGPDGSFVLTIKLKEGMNEITARAVDIAGNVSGPSSPIFVVYQVHPLGNLLIMAVEGVGKLYARRLEEQGVKTIRDLSVADVFALHKKTGISLVSLYTWKRKAALVMEVKVDRTLFEKILQMRLEDIMAVTDDELSRKANQPSEVISDLKTKISTLLVALNNVIVRGMKLENIASSRS